MSNVADAVFAHAFSEPDRVAVRAAGRETTFGALRDAAASLAARAAQAGVRPGDRVLLVAPSVPEFVAAYYGLHAAGATVITMNVMATTREVAYVVEDADVRLVVAWHETAAAAERTAAERGLPSWTLGPLDGWDVSERVTAPVDLPDDATALIIYTSGTTGRPKGAELAVSALAAIVDAAEHALEFDEDDRTGTALPLFHVFGQVMVMHLAISFGTSVSLLHPFDPRALVDMIRDDELTIVSGVPTMWIAMLHAAADATPDDFSRLRLASSGGASLPIEVIRAFEERFGTRIREGYGLSETCGWATFTPLDAEPKTGAVGRAVHGVEIEVRDMDGAPLPTGEVGEVWIRGPIVMKGYWNRPDATADVLRDGWLRTGDLGTLDEDGDLRIVDRLKDLIIRGGYNVYPSEVEEVLYEHPDIVEAAVVGVADPTYGEEVGAVVVLRQGAELAPDTLREWAKERLSAYKVPRLFHVVDALPKGPSGKILKRAIDRDSLLGARAGSR
ncbi:AMP-binding protein [Mumia zhuanghuii]|uniref:Long-chain fatty acid--CoA ligase n=1 Tax=Mumia zhuanghuii TaxID=2585211 RepID=A0A5C4MTN8_9ACTN|nr:AMP-binding protein [Mumia zhuanghuii]TNC30943.1 long-chain fatty acid--CoA ligase [Mumia zhuanghuii]TNC49410.1 long-chain fatty acid--CoA ligase [Mumia zhuanghuii]